MKDFQKNIDSMISRILQEEINSKSELISEQISGEWTEIKVEEELHGNQKKLDVAEPKGKITAADFAKLRKNKEKTEMEEHDAFGDYHGDNEQRSNAEKLSQQEPTYVGRGLKDNKIGAEIKNKIFGSFTDTGDWYDEQDKEHTGEFDFDYDEEEFEDFEPFYEKFGEKTNWFAPGDEGKKFFDMYKERFGPMLVRTPRDLGEEAETEEGNAFTGALAKAKEEGDDSFEVDGKKFHVKEEKDNKKWIQKTGMKKGALHKKLGVPEGDKLPTGKLKSLKKELSKKAEGDKKLSAADSKLLKQVNLALTLKGIKENKNSLRLSENELIDMIEKIVLEQSKKKTVKDKAEKNNISKKEATGLKKTEKVLQANKKENDEYAKSVVKKMKEYVKAGSVGEFNESPEKFPESNYTMGKMKADTMKYHPSQAVDEYIDAFAYPGMTNVTYDEIKPDDKKIKKYIKGDSTTGNAVKGTDGKPLGNVAPSEVGEKFMKNYEENLYGAEQKNASYKRYPMPVDIPGSETTKGSLKKIKGNSTQKAQKILNQLESVDDKKQKFINEEMEKMKNLISYNKKTQ